MRSKLFNTFAFYSFFISSGYNSASTDDLNTAIKKITIGALSNKGGSSQLEYFSTNEQLSDRSALIYIHGGGFVYDSSTYKVLANRLFNRTNVATLFYVRYSLAPEHVYPRAVDDCVEICKWIFDHSEELGIDKNRIQLVGDSAGGNLVINVALHLLREKDKYPLLGLHSIYPVVQLVHRLPSSHHYEVDPTGVLYYSEVPRFLTWYLLGNLTCYTEISEGNYVSINVAQRFKQLVSQHNLGTIRSSRDINLNKMQVSDNVCSKMLEPFLLDWRFTLIFAPEDLLGMLKQTNVFIYTCEVDVLADEGFMFVKLLQSLGVNVEHYYGEDCFHGSIGLDFSIGGANLLDALSKNFKKASL